MKEEEEEIDDFSLSLSLFFIKLVILSFLVGCYRAAAAAALV